MLLFGKEKGLRRIKRRAEKSTKKKLLLRCGDPCSARCRQIGCSALRSRHVLLLLLPPQCAELLIGSGDAPSIASVGSEVCARRYAGHGCRRRRPLPLRCCCCCDWWWCSSAHSGCVCRCGGGAHGAVCVCVCCASGGRVWLESAQQRRDGDGRRKNLRRKDEGREGAKQRHPGQRSVDQQPDKGNGGGRAVVLVQATSEAQQLATLLRLLGGRRREHDNTRSRRCRHSDEDASRRRGAGSTTMTIACAGVAAVRRRRQRRR